MVDCSIILNGLYPATDDDRMMHMIDWCFMVFCITVMKEVLVVAESMEGVLSVSVEWASLRRASRKAGRHNTRANL